MADLTDREVRLRLIEAAARNPDPRHEGGFAASVRETAAAWESFVNFSTTEAPAPDKRGTLSLPKKG